MFLVKAYHLFGSVRRPSLLALGIRVIVPNPICDPHNEPGLIPGLAGLQHHDDLSGTMKAFAVLCLGSYQQVHGLPLQLLSLLICPVSPLVHPRVP